MDDIVAGITSLFQLRVIIKILKYYYNRVAISLAVLCRHAYAHILARANSQAENSELLIAQLSTVTIILILQLVLKTALNLIIFLVAHSLLQWLMEVIQCAALAFAMAA